MSTLTTRVRPIRGMKRSKRKMLVRASRLLLT